jgi:hypothetical protein
MYNTYYKIFYLTGALVSSVWWLFIEAGTDNPIPFSLEIFLVFIFYGLIFLGGLIFFEKRYWLGFLLTLPIYFFPYLRMVFVLILWKINGSV